MAHATVAKGAGLSDEDPDRRATAGSAAEAGALVGRLIPAARNPEDVERLIAASASSAPPAFREWIQAEARESGRRAREGTLDGFLWAREPVGAVALAVLERHSIGVEVRLYLAPELKNPEEFAGLLEALGHAGPPGVKSIGLSGVDLGPTSFGQVLRDRGFEEIRRVDMTYPRESAIPATRAPPGLRPLAPTDEQGLARLLEVAYSDNPIDRALFAREPGVGDARVAVSDLLHGRVGDWLAGASFGVDVEGTLRAATMAQKYHGFLISEVMVDPGYRGLGWAKSLLARTIEALREAGTEVTRLVVTRTNPRAMGLYRSLGFVERPETEGGVWLNLRMFPAAAQQFYEAAGKVSPPQGGHASA